MFSKKSKFTFCDAGGMPFDVGYSGNCFVKDGNATVGYVHDVSVSGTALNIEHFAVQSGLKGMGEVILRAFAKFVDAQAPGIQTMNFDLGRATSESDIAKLAAARVALLRRVGAVNVQQRPGSTGSIVVSGTWQKTNW